MQKRTHATFGVALASIILAPATTKMAAVTIGASFIGSLIPDIDVSTSDSHKTMNIIAITSLVITIAFLILDYYLNFGLLSLMKKNFNIVRTILCFLITILLCAHGLHTPHRTFMHSIVSASIFTVLMYFLFKPGYKAFFIGYIAHILLDLLNKKRVQLFYPFKTKFCLNLCESDGLINNIICTLSIVLLIICN